MGCRGPSALVSVDWAGRGWAWPSRSQTRLPRLPAEKAAEPLPGVGLVQSWQEAGFRVWFMVVSGVLVFSLMQSV